MKPQADDYSELPASRFGERLPRTSLYQGVVGVAVAFRWLLILGGALWFYLRGGFDVGAAWVFGAAVVYNAVLTALHQLGRHPPVLLVSMVDVAAILTFLILVGPGSHTLYLFGLLALVVTLAHGWLGAALALGGYLIGESALMVTDPATGPDLAALLLRAGSLAIGASALGAFVARFDALRAQLTLGAVFDRVTGLYTRHHFAEALERLHKMAIRGQRVYSALVIGVEGLDNVIREKGKSAADGLLRTMGVQARAVIRSTDLLGRVGKDEFAVALPETGLPGAELVASKLHDRLREVSGGLGVVVGVAELQPTRQSAPDDGLRAAYAAVERAKAAGGDRIATMTVSREGTAEHRVNM